MKKILILTANTGHGHTSAAKAIKQAVEHLYPQQFDIEITDLIELLSPSINKVTQKSYDSLALRAPIIFDFIIKSWDKQWKIKLLNRLNYPVALRKFKKFFATKKPDLIISTFPVWDFLVHKLLKKHHPGVKLVSVITDSILIHNAWITGNANKQIVANQDTADAIIKLGFDPQKISALGFPVKLEFLKPLDKTAFFQEQNLDSNRFTILFLPAVQKYKINLKLIEELSKNFKDCNIIIIAGRDVKIKKRIDRHNFPQNIKVIGWTDQMPSYIKAADVVLTKGGGATVMECIAAEKPLIITSTIGAWERGNAELVKRYKVGIVETKNKLQISKSIQTIQKSYKMYQKNLKKISNPGAALAIAKELIKYLN